MRTSEKLLRSILYEKEFTSRRGTAEVEELFGKKVFSFPKPVELLKTFLKVATDKNSLVLDFFAGSGTLGQALLELNQEDEGNRKFILVQVPELTDKKSLAFKNNYKIISDITIERNKRAIEKIIKKKKEEQPNLFTNGHKEDAIKGLGFKVFKLVKSNFPRVEWAPDVEKTEAENIELLKKYIKEKEAQLITAFNRDELMTEILLKHGFTLNYKTEKQKQFKKNEIFLATDEIKETLICLDISIDAETIEYFKKNIDKKFICLERALDTTKKYNLKHYLGDKFNAF
jgi:adenine-specific DNA-methyltransferase